MNSARIVRRLLVGLAAAAARVPRRTALRERYAWPNPARGLATRAELAAARAAASLPVAAATPAQVATLFAAIEAGLQGMVEANAPRFVVTRGGRELTIETGAEGRAPFVLSVDAAGTLSLSSPKGEHGMRFYERRGDGHYLLELLARDLIYCAKGFPSFASGL